MRSSFVLSILASLAAVVVGQSNNTAGRDTNRGCTVSDADYCKGTNHTSDKYLCGDPRLGPVKLPQSIPLGYLMNEYDRLGGLCPGAFLQNWTLSTGAYKYPPLGGFQLDTSGKPIQGNQTLTVGMRIDRFGSPHGDYVSPAYAPYIQRALPPSNLDAPAGDPTYPYNYHVYEVLKPFTVLAGPIAAWFGQPGQGTQYHTPMQVGALVNSSYLRELTRPEY